MAEREPTAEDATCGSVRSAGSKLRALARRRLARGEPERPRARAGPDSKGEASAGAKRAPGGWVPTQRGLGAA